MAGSAALAQHHLVAVHFDPAEPCQHRLAEEISAEPLENYRVDVLDRAAGDFDPVERDQLPAGRPRGALADDGEARGINI